jgi:MoxR-like ATPase
VSVTVELSLREIEDRVAAVHPIIDRVRGAVAGVVVGQQQMIDRLIAGLLTGGHVLLEGVPGLAKTLSVRALSQAMQMEFRRIQFTPDLLPADVVGTEIYNPLQGTFSTRRGPVFTNILLADEINRAPAKVQSALLEAMAERQVTLGDETHRLPSPFLVLATQNPLEQEGTYPLPEAQADRFMVKVRVGYPTRSEEREILARSERPTPKITPAATIDDIVRCREVMGQLKMEPVVSDYIVEIVHATRSPADAGLRELAPLIEFGVSPRATISLAAMARANAFLDGRGFVTPDDVKAVGVDVMRHRILLTYEAEADGLSVEDVIDSVFQKVKVS